MQLYEQCCELHTKQPRGEAAAISPLLLEELAGGIVDTVDSCDLQEHRMAQLSQRSIEHSVAGSMEYLTEYFDGIFDGTFDDAGGRTFDRTLDGSFDGAFDARQLTTQT